MVGYLLTTNLDSVLSLNPPFICVCIHMHMNFSRKLQLKKKANIAGIGLSEVELGQDIGLTI